MSSIPTQKHSIYEVQQVIQSKSELYEAALRNGFYLPKLKSSIVTEQYLHDVINKRVFCPLYKEIKLLPCPRPLTRRPCSST
jgi:hypothetical protein